MHSPKNNNSRWVSVGILIIIALLGVNAWLFYQKMEDGKTIEQQGEDLATARELTAELEKQYYETLSQLEEMRSDSEASSELVDKQKEEISSQKREIERLIRETRDYNTIRKKMKELEALADQYYAELDALREQNALLAEANEQLNDANRALTQTVEKERSKGIEQQRLQEQTEKEKMALAGENKQLTTKITEASVVPVSKVDITGFKLSDSGKESRKRYADNIDGLRICFDAGANTTTDPGMEKFHIRILSPIGQTIGNEDMGAGVLTTADGDQVRFSTIHAFDYNRQAVNSCLSWKPGMPLEKGIYQVEIYNKGYLCGTGSFRLK